MATTTRILDANVNGTVYTSNANSALEALDTCHSGATAPTDEVANGKLWLDTSTTPGILKIYNNATWTLVQSGTDVNVTGAFTSLGIDDNATSVAITIDASENVGIGTISPDTLLHLAATSGATLRLESSTTALATGGVLGAVEFETRDVGTEGVNAKIDSVFENTVGDTSLRFFTSPASGAITTTPQMTIDSSGVVLAGNDDFNGIVSSNLTGVALQGAGTLWAARSDVSAVFNRLSTNGSIVQLKREGTPVGTISVTASATAYNTSSDYRLKENITPVQGAADIVKAMQPVTYTFKSDGSWHDGFLAHELQELHPRAVIGEKDAMVDEEYEVTPAVYEDVVIPAVDAVAEVPAVYDDEGVLVSEMVPAVEAQPERTEQQLVSEAVMGTRSVPDYQGVDYSKLTPILTAALQEALNKIDALEARVAALEL